MEEEINHTVVISNGDSKVTRSLTGKPPAHFILKIDSFWSLLKTIGDARAGSYESEVFEAGGYKWKLSLYPEGDKGNKATGYISIYLVIVDAHYLPQDWEVVANLKFFVYDHFKNKYLTVQDANATASRFDAKTTGFGFAKFLPLCSFVYAGNGCLVRGKCEFGVEVIVKNYQGPDCFHRTVDTVKMVYGSYTCKIKKFSSLTAEYYRSNVFAIGNRIWNFVVYLNGAPSEENNMLSVYLEVEDSNLFPEQKTFAKIHICIGNQLGRKDMQISFRGHCFSKTSPCGGYPAFFPLADHDLHDPSKGFLVNDTLILKAHVHVFPTVRTFSKAHRNPTPNEVRKKITMMNFSGGTKIATKLPQEKVTEGFRGTEGKKSGSSKQDGVVVLKAIQSRRSWWFLE